MIDISCCLTTLLYELFLSHYRPRTTYVDTAYLKMECGGRVEGPYGDKIELVGSSAHGQGAVISIGKLQKGITMKEFTSFLETAMSIRSKGLMQKDDNANDSDDIELTGGSFRAFWIKIQANA